MAGRNKVFCKFSWLVSLLYLFMITFSKFQRKAAATLPAAASIEISSVTGLSL